VSAVLVVNVVMMPPFMRAYKKMHTNQKKAVNDSIAEIIKNPQAGELKKGDLAGIYVYKFQCVNQLMLLSYEYDPQTRILLYLAVHENFYRDMKR
jgi:mRNA-degrading endonuclease RelE of RelBE toxin-antitoxin system